MPDQLSRNLYPLDGGQSPQYENGVDIVNDYEFEPGVCILPLAESPPTDETTLKSWSPVVKLQLHAPYRIRKVAYKAQKSNTPPVMPSPVDAGSFVLVGGNLVTHNTLSTGRATYDWQVACLYTYVDIAPNRVGDGFVLGSPPWINETVAEALQATGTVPVATVGSVATAGFECLLGKYLGDKITFDATDRKSAYFYAIPSFYPGTFFNDFIVNGGPPMVENPRG